MVDENSSSKGSLLEDAQDLVFPEDDVLLVVDLGPGVLTEEDAVPGLDLERRALAVLLEPAAADCDHLPLHRLLLRRVGDDDPASLLLLLLDPLDEHAVVQGLHLHDFRPPLGYKILKTSNLF